MTNTIDSKQLAEHIASLLDKKKARDVTASRAFVVPGIRFRSCP